MVNFYFIGKNILRLLTSSLSVYKKSYIFRIRKKIFQSKWEKKITIVNLS